MKHDECVKVSQRGVRHGLEQMDTPGLRRLKNWIEAGKPVLMNGETAVYHISTQECDL